MACCKRKFTINIISIKKRKNEKYKTYYINNSLW